MIAAIATSTEHINALPRGSRSVMAHAAYVAESRHRRQSWLVASDGAERQEISGRRPLGDARPIRARNPSRWPEKSSTLLFLEPGRGPRERTRFAVRTAPSRGAPLAGRQPTTLRRTSIARQRLRAAASRQHKTKARRIR